MERHALRSWLAGHRAAARRQLELARAEGAPSPADSFAAAMELLDLAGPIEEDAVRRREVAEVRAVWARLKRPWAGRSDSR